MEIKKRNIVETTKTLFMKFGIRRVSIEEICSEASVSKGTFYKYFKNKSDLAKFVYNWMVEEAMQEYRDLMDSDISFTEKVHSMIKMKLKNTRGMSREFTTDIYNSSDPELKKLHQEKAKEGLEVIIADLKLAQEKGELRKNLRIDFINYFLNHMIVMMQDQQLLALYNNSGEVIAELTNFFFYGVLPCNTEDEER